MSTRLNIRCPQCAGKAKVVVSFLLDAHGKASIPVLEECDMCAGTGINFAPFFMGSEGKFDLLDAATSNINTVQVMLKERGREGHTAFFLVANTADWHAISVENTPEEDQLRPLAREDVRPFEVELKLISDMPKGRAVLFSVAAEEEGTNES